MKKEEKHLVLVDCPVLFLSTVESPIFILFVFEYWNLQTICILSAIKSKSTNAFRVIYSFHFAGMISFNNISIFLLLYLTKFIPTENQSVNFVNATVSS